ncbi:DUF4956 domain-containing protein [Pseudomonadota bacterium]|nr:DUF4956 domain-containing protein [Pseudomonadota bacterium]
MNLILDNFDKIISVIGLLLGSLYFRMILQALGQNWIKTVAHTATLSLLPIFTYIITSVISGNIALSLGMVGALSIVRFRNPVRSPLELSVYFGAITMGITASVSIKWLILLIVSSTIVGLVLVTINYIHLYFKKTSFFTMSFSEGNIVSSLTVITTIAFDTLEKSEYLIGKNMENKILTYTFASENFAKLHELDSSLEGLKGINTRILTK